MQNWHLYFFSGAMAEGFRLAVGEVEVAGRTVMAEAGIEDLGLRVAHKGRQSSPCQPKRGGVNSRR